MEKIENVKDRINFDFWTENIELQKQINKRCRRLNCIPTLTIVKGGRWVNTLVVIVPLVAWRSQSEISLYAPFLYVCSSWL